MYCSSCGVAVAQGVTYCNYCGAKLPRDQGKTPREVKPETLVTMMVATFVMGTFVITLLLGMLRAVLHLEFGPMMGIAMLSFLMMFVLEGVFIKLLFASRGSSERVDDRILPKRPGTTRELDEARYPAIEPAASVTEHTTRIFDPVLSDRK